MPVPKFLFSHSKSDLWPILKMLGLRLQDVKEASIKKVSSDAKAKLKILIFNAFKDI